jgi:hypothetical protein
MEVLAGIVAVLAATIVSISITVRANRSVREFRAEAHRSFAHEYLENLRNQSGGGR